MNPLDEVVKAVEAALAATWVLPDPITTGHLRTLLDGLKASQERERRLLWVIESMKQEAETGAQGDETMMLDACNEISKQGLAALTTPKGQL